MSYETFYKIGQTLETDWRQFEQDNNEGAWYLRYIAGALSLVVAYLFAQYLGDHERTVVSIMGFGFAFVFFAYSAVMWREVSKVAIWLIAIYAAYVMLEKALDTSPASVAIVFSAAWIVWAIKSKK
jgi:hypothetical protein